MKNNNDYLNSENTTRILDLHDQWCRDNGYPIKKRKVYKGKWHDEKEKEEILTRTR